jgi:hypothetical protein
VSYAVRRTAVAFICSLLAACGGGDSLTGGSPPAPKGASLTITVSNLPPGATAGVTLSGPNNFSRTIGATTTVTDLVPGSYTITASRAETETEVYAPLQSSQNVELTTGTSRSADVAFIIASGMLDVDVRGLPANTGAALNVAGPDNFFRQVTGDTRLVKLTPGTYTFTSATVLASGDVYGVAGTIPPVNVAAASAPFLATIDYTLISGRLLVQANGLPTGAAPVFQVNGPGGYSQSATQGQVLTGLMPGSYTIASPNVSLGGTTYVPNSVTQTVNVSVSTTPVQANVTYALAGGGGGGAGQINLTIENLYVTQAVQTLVGDVPLVAGRDGLVRVFVKANAANTAQPQVRVRLYNGSTLVSTLMLDAPMTAVPTTPDDATLASAWYAPVHGSLIQPGLRILADVDPSNTVAEGSEADNTWPASGVAATMFVKTVPMLSIRFVPIKQSNDLTGNVTTANAAAFLNDIRRMYPIGSVDADVRATYTSTSGVVQSNDNNNAWNAVLNEINALRALDGSTRYYYGVVKTSYASGVAGMGYLGAPVSIGWDYLPSGADVMAHELGHNWGRYHAPCGGAGSPDPNFPYTGGRIGVSGFDMTMNVFKPASTPDLMGYCVPNWVSDWTYKGIMNYRETHSSVVAARSAAPEPGLLVWGRVSGSEIVLEPAFDVVAPARLPERTGPHRIEAFTDDGSSVFSIAFEGEAVDHADPTQRHFAFVVPKRMMRSGAVTTER